MGGRGGGEREKGSSARSPGGGVETRERGSLGLWGECHWAFRRLTQGEGRLRLGKVWARRGWALERHGSLLSLKFFLKNL
mgnify:CR=1 FL=1